MVCLVCHSIAPGPLCVACGRTLRRAPERLLPGGIRLVGAFEHRGAARVLTHHLKYRGVTRMAEIAAKEVVARLPRLPLVPVPRAVSRRLRYGVDPARVVATAIARQLKVPVVDVLSPPIHARRRAGGDHSRGVRPFRLKAKLRFPAIVVDDVVTTGATVTAAVEAVGTDLVRAVAAASLATDVYRVDSRMSPKPGEDGIWPAF